MGDRAPHWARHVDWYRVRIRFLEPLLAMTPAEASVYEQWIRPAQADRAAREAAAGGVGRAGATLAAAQAEEGTVYVPRVWTDPKEARARAKTDAEAAADEDHVADEHPQQMTLFPADAHGPFLWDYQVRGHLKEVANLAKTDFGIANMRAKVAAGLVVRPRRIYLAGQRTEPVKRPLRAQTPQGLQTAIAASEGMMAGATATFYLGRLPVMDPQITWTVLRDLLDWGEIRGLGQWRTGGWGIYEVLDWAPVTETPPRYVYPDVVPGDLGTLEAIWPKEAGANE